MLSVLDLIHCGILLFCFNFFAKTFFTVNVFCEDYELEFLVRVFWVKKINYSLVYGHIFESNVDYKNVGFVFIRVWQDVCISFRST